MLVDLLCNFLRINSKEDDSYLHSSSLHSSSSPQASILSILSSCIYIRGFPPRMHSNTAFLCHLPLMALLFPSPNRYEDQIFLQDQCDCFSSLPSLSYNLLASSVTCGFLIKVDLPADLLHQCTLHRLVQYLHLASSCHACRHLPLLGFLCRFDILCRPRLTIGLVCLVGMTINHPLCFVHRLLCLYNTQTTFI